MEESKEIEARKEAIINVAQEVAKSDEVTLKKLVVCAFYKGGKHIDCMRCKNPDEAVEDCTESYLDGIFIRPQDVWSQAFDVPLERERVPINSVISGLGMRCDSCYISDVCPQFKKGFACGIDWGTPVSGLTNKEILNRLIDIQESRIKRAAEFEKIDGGVPDQNLSVEMDRLTALLKEKADLDINRVSLNISAESKGPAQQQGSGILSQLFGGALGGNKQQALPEEKPVTIDIPFTEEAAEPIRVNKPMKSESAPEVRSVKKSKISKKSSKNR